MNINEESLKLHRKVKGKIAIKNKIPLNTMHDLSLAYTPGVASACLAISNDPNESYNLTSKHNTVAVISDGTAVLGLGNIGPLGAMPVMEGKAAIFKKFAGIDAIPIVLNTTNVDEIVQTVVNIAPSFGGINLEDISAPRCFEVERRLKELLDIPVFHDDQHGTAIVAGAALLNALKVANKKLNNVKIVINGAGSAGIAICKFLMALGAKHIVVCDKSGILSLEDTQLNSSQIEIAKATDTLKYKGGLKEALVGSDVFIGVSVGNIVTEEMVRSMNKDAICFPLANPIPEIDPILALKANALVIGTGLSNLPNQINNALVFPGLFKGALAARVKQITLEMEIAACKALARIIKPSELKADYIIPSIFNKSVSRKIMNAVLKAAK